MRETATTRDLADRRVTDGVVQPAAPLVATGRRRDDRLVVASPSTKDAVDRATRGARQGHPIVIRGPAGSGRATLARAIHAWSRDASGPLEIINAHAIPEPLQRREIFGCAAGTYPAMPDAFAGALERASGGTLVVEDLEGLAPAARAALAKTVAAGAFRREGGGDPLPLQTRLVATAELDTPADALGEAHGEVLLAPLSERPEDVLALASHFLARFSADQGVEPVGFTSDARAALLEEVWAGNVAELRERIRGALSLAQSGALTAEALLLASEPECVPSFREAKRAFETRYVVTLLRRCDGNISQAARLAKKDRKDFYDVIRRTGVDPATYRR